MTSTYQTRIQDTSYNGWTNYETWNVALWIQNDEGLYQWARDYRHYGYKRFAEALCEFSSFDATPDGVKWDDDSLNVCELDEMMEEL